VLSITTSGNYFVTVTDAGGCKGSSDTIYVSLAQRPQKPTIQRSGDVLMTVNAFAYQWYKDGISIPNAVSQYFVVLQTGTYSVRVTNEEGCNAVSDNVEVSILDIGREFEEVATETFSLYPQPVTDNLNIRTNIGEVLVKAIALIDVSGKSIITLLGEHMIGNAYEWRLSTVNLENGVYYLIIITDNGVFVHRVMKS